MGKKSRQRRAEPAESTAPGQVGPRQPCPCGSGRRYKSCHGSADGAPPVFVARPFAGLPGETDLVALREFVPAATAPLTLREGDREVLVASLLPGASPALVRADGAIWLGLQVQQSYADPSRDLAAVLTLALDAEPGSVVSLTEDPGEGPRLQDLVVADQTLDVTVHAGFDYWVADLEDPDGSVRAALEQANEATAPTTRVAGVDSAYWTSMGNREYLRWVLPQEEDRVLDGLARLHVAQAERLVEGDRLIGMFRAHGLVVPVWDLPVGTGAAALEAPLGHLVTTLTDAVEDTTPLTSEQRSARAGLISRQLTLR
ncbi:MAG: motif protein [Marmoricola sp.]|nr:motif protein [Marmoricola sp.]